MMVDTGKLIEMEEHPKKAIREIFESEIQAGSELKIETCESLAERFYTRSL